MTKCAHNWVLYRQKFDSCMSFPIRRTFFKRKFVVNHRIQVGTWHPLGWEEDWYCSLCRSWDQERPDYITEMQKIANKTGRVVYDWINKTYVWPKEYQ